MLPDDGRRIETRALSMTQASREWRYVFALSVAAIASVYLPGCDRDGRSGGAGETRDASDIGGSGLNVLLISIDTLRADHLGCYGHSANHTPNIDRLAAEGARFAQCISSAPVTLPSHASMLTGSYPYVHGLRMNGAFRLAPENVTLAETFHNAGYATHAQVASSIMNWNFGLDQGFDSYVDLLSTGVNERVERELLVERSADVITQAGIQLLGELAQQPFFLFLHYYDPHDPYDPPQRFRGRFGHPYVEEIAFVDEQIGRLFAALRDAGLDKRTLIVLTSDHGEALGEHAELTHAFFVYDSTLHVPLILWAPDHIPAGRVIEQQVRLIDLAPTIVDFVDLPRTPQMQGRSLLPLIEAPRQPWSTPCYADTLYPKYVFGFSALRSLRADGWKYIHAPNPELYHVAEDPGERNDLATQIPARVAAMRAALRDLIAKSPAPLRGGASRTVLDPEQRRALESLGYAAPSGAAVHVEGSELEQFEPQGANPRDRVRVLKLEARAMQARIAGRDRDVEKHARAALEVAPTSPTLHAWLANALAGQQRLDEALASYRKASELDPYDAYYRVETGRILAFRGDRREAEQCFRAAIEIDELYFEPRAALGDLFLGERRYAEAAAAFQAAAEIAPQVASIFIRWGRALRGAGRFAEAEAKLRQSCRVDPASVPARIQLAALLLQTDRRDEAVQELLAAHRFNPDHLRPISELARLYSLNNEHERAVEFYRKALALQPQAPSAQHNLGYALVLAGEPEQALAHFREALRLDPSFTEALLALALALERLERLDQAAETVERRIADAPADARRYLLAADLRRRSGALPRAVQILRRGHDALPENLEIVRTLAWHLATAPDAEWRDGEQALLLAKRASELAGPDSPRVLDTLAAAYANAGRLEEAVAAAETALTLARQASVEPALVSEIEQRLERYRRGQPYRQDADASAP